MREYATPSAFRAAVEARLRQRAGRLGKPTYVLRRQAALERLAVRLVEVAPGHWAVKGGFALETRLGDRARVSLDLDADHRQGAEAARAELQRATSADLGDCFGFALTGAEELRAGGVGLAVRYKLESSLAGRPFEPLQVDVSVAAPDPWDGQPATRPGLLADLGFDPIEILVIPVARQVAEKLHAYTRTFGGGGTTRSRDLVDLLLIREHHRPDSTSLREAICVVFDRRATHDIPHRLPSPPRELAPAYRREAERVDVASRIGDAHRLLAEWIDPILAGTRPRRSSG